MNISTYRGLCISPLWVDVYFHSRPYYSTCLVHKNTHTNTHALTLSLSLSLSLCLDQEVLMGPAALPESSTCVYSGWVGSVKVPNTWLVPGAVPDSSWRRARSCPGCRVPVGSLSVCRAREVNCLVFGSFAAVYILAAGLLLGYGESCFGTTFEITVFSFCFLFPDKYLFIYLFIYLSIFHLSYSSFPLSFCGQNMYSYSPWECLWNRFFCLKSEEGEPAKVLSLKRESQQTTLHQSRGSYPLDVVTGRQMNMLAFRRRHDTAGKRYRSFLPTDNIEADGNERNWRWLHLLFALDHSTVTFVKPGINFGNLHP